LRGRPPMCVFRRGGRARRALLPELASGVGERSCRAELPSGVGQPLTFSAGNAGSHAVILHHSRRSETCAPGGGEVLPGVGGNFGRTGPRAPIPKCSLWK